MSTIVKCPACNGTGQSKLSPPLQSVVDAVKSLGEPTRGEIFKYLPERKRIDLTAVYQRVLRLNRMNVLRRIPNVRPARYQVVE